MVRVLELHTHTHNERSTAPQAYNVRMDPLTQGLLGAAASQALFQKQLGRKAWLIGAVGGVLPDADVFIRSDSDPLLAIEHHRGFTHALAFIPVGGAIASLPWLIRKKYRYDWKPVLGGAVAAYATHGLLDACTTYGTQLLWPFSSLRVAWNVISIVDPIFTLVLLAGVVAAAWLRRRWPAAAALVLCLMYLGLGTIQRDRALDVQTRVAELRQHTTERQAAFPTIGNLLVWRSLYEAGDSLYADRLRVGFFGDAAWQAGSSVEKTQLDDLPTSLRRHPRVRKDYERFAWFSDGWVAAAPDAPDVYGDVRYSLRTDGFDPIWGIRFHPRSNPATEWVDRTRDREFSIGALWMEIAGRADYQPAP